MTGFHDRDLETLDPAALRAHQWSKLQGLARAIHPANAFVARR